MTKENEEDAAKAKRALAETTTKQGYGNTAKFVTRRYRVYRIDYCSYRTHELTLWAVTIRKDGTDGDKHEIWQDWEVEDSQ